MNVFLSLLGVGVLGISLLGNYYLYGEVKEISEAKAKMETRATELEVTLKFKEAEYLKNDTKIAKYQEQVNQLTSQRDSYRKKTQEAMRNDASFNTWGNTLAHPYVTSSFQRLREERINNSRNSGK